MLTHELKQEIERLVRGRTGWQIRDLRVDVREGGTITLHGACTSFYAKQLAQEAAMSASKDGVLENAITVEPAQC